MHMEVWSAAAHGVAKSGHNWMTEPLPWMYSLRSFKALTWITYLPLKIKIISFILKSPSYL